MMFLGTKLRQLLLRDLARGRHFPDQAVVERKLLERRPVQTIDAAVADMRDQRFTLRQHHKHARRRAHPVKLGVRFAAAMDLRD